MQLGYNSNGELYVQLPQGAQSNSNKLNIYVNIIDNLGGVRVFDLDTPVVVTKNKDLVTTIANEVLNFNPSTDLSTLSQFAQDIYSGDTKLATRNIIILTSTLNGDNSNQVKVYILIMYIYIIRS
jgi:hypothetical protein